LAPGIVATGSPSSPGTASSQASGIIIIIACGRVRPPSVSISTMLSNCAESLLPGTMIGFSRSSPPENLALLSWLRRACIQLVLPRSVLISPLCAM
jgi:hypothetical protein